MVQKCGSLVNVTIGLRIHLFVKNNTVEQNFVSITTIETQRKSLSKMMFTSNPEMKAWQVRNEEKESQRNGTFIRQFKGNFSTRFVLFH